MIINYIGIAGVTLVFLGLGIVVLTGMAIIFDMVK
jgi:hypothetical protein